MTGLCWAMVWIPPEEPAQTHWMITDWPAEGPDLRVPVNTDLLAPNTVPLL